MSFRHRWNQLSPPYLLFSLGHWLQCTEEGMVRLLYAISLSPIGNYRCWESAWHWSLFLFERDPISWCNSASLRGSSDSARTVCYSSWVDGFSAQRARNSNNNTISPTAPQVKLNDTRRPLWFDWMDDEQKLIVAPSPSQPVTVYESHSYIGQYTLSVCLHSHTFEYLVQCNKSMTSTPFTIQLILLRHSLCPGVFRERSSVYFPNCAGPLFYDAAPKRVW